MNTEEANNTMNCSLLKKIRQKENVLVIGMLSLLLSIFLGRFFREIPVADFFAGLFTGLALVFNVFYLVLFGRENRMKHDK